MTNIQESRYNDAPLATTLNGRILAHLKFMKRCMMGKKSLLQYEPTSLLDVGCASGSVLLAVDGNLKMAGVDISSVQVEIARKNGIDAHVCNLEHQSLPFEDNSFDVVCAFDIIEHVLHTDHILNELNRVVKPGGLLIASVPNIYQPASFLMMLMDRTPMYAARYRGLHVRDFTPNLFRHVLCKHGFSPKRINGTCIFPFEAAGWSHLLANWFHRLGAITVVAALKDRRVEIDEGVTANFSDLEKFLKQP